MSELSRRIGVRIRKLRTAPGRNWTQEQLAERANLSVSFLSMVERGERVPHVHTLANLSAALGIRLGELFEGVDAPDEGSITVPSGPKRSGYDAMVD